ncbi:hypothetical protein FGO68_gene7889 [Halteria grandinella]|uniref:Uncharacterized protein n=1 Tax=Halteria grandinella TaxID=5974 RepID=A0A8J8P6I4_HALGN|nr:hypothetical protein FGO68_gene7889 [Halteria grandinella]
MPQSLFLLIALATSYLVQSSLISFSMSMISFIKFSSDSWPGFTVQRYRDYVEMQIMSSINRIGKNFAYNTDWV